MTDLSAMAISVTISVHAYARYFEHEHMFITYFIYRPCVLHVV